MKRHLIAVGLLMAWRCQHATDADLRDQLRNCFSSAT